MENRDWKTIDAIVIECTKTLFGGMGIEIERRDVPRCTVGDREMLAMVGFGGAHLRGAFVLGVSRRVLTASYPAPAPRLGLDEMRDWCAELLNLLAGRVKNQLLGRGITIDMATPAALTGVRLELVASAASAPCVPHSFRACGAPLHVRFEAVAAEGVALCDEGPEAPILSESDVLLF